MSSSHLRDVAGKMSVTLKHRGPNSSGVWVDASCGLGLAHTRLAIIDLTVEGHQPMQSASGRYVVSFNGEIYNFSVLRTDLEDLGYQFHGHSDTEVLLASVETWGIKPALKRFIGMFAFALWDRQERVLTLARDRIGEKPLYYGWQDKSLLFGSELKALRANPSWKGVIDRDALAQYMRLNYIPTPYSIYLNVRKLIPGSLVQIPGRSEPGVFPKPILYWQAKDVAENGVNNTYTMTDSEAVNSLDNLLRQTIRDKMVSDVPLGAFLSGGIDSSAVVALMQAESERPVKTFTIGFHEKEYNEALHAKAVANYLGTEHTEMYVTSEQALEVIPKLPALYDEPFSDSSQIPTYLVCEMTRQHVTVALSGDGGDELFGGYNRYIWCQTIWNRINPVPVGLRSALAWIIQGVSPRHWNNIFDLINPILPENAKQRLPGDKLHKIADILPSSSPEEMYKLLVSHWKNPLDIVRESEEYPIVITDEHRWANLPDFVQRMQFLDLISYLPDDILVKVDRAAMGVSLETRVPFLDHRVVQFAWQLSQSKKIRNGKGKWILREVLGRYIPNDIMDRPKMGFGVPIDSWLRGPLREWAESLLNEKRLDSEGIFNSGPIRHKWEEHLSGKRNWQHYLWDVLMFQAWLEASG